MFVKFLKGDFEKWYSPANFKSFTVANGNIYWGANEEVIFPVLFLYNSRNGVTQKEEILYGFLTIANERMSDAIKKISIAKGYAPPQYALVAFGGAGGLHACSMARMLNIDTILLPKHAGLLSAYGIINAKIERFSEKQIHVK